jgi:hypothetical protein
MASDAVPGSVPAGLVHGSQAPKSTTVKLASGNAVPPAGNSTSAPAEKVSGPPKSAGAPASLSKQPSPPTTATNKADLPQLVTQLNKYLNDSGRPNQFRVDPASRGQTIQEINPANGEVIGEFSAAQFPELARSLGASGVGVLVDGHA